MVALPSSSTSAAITAATQSQSFILSAGVRKTIQSIKDIVGNFSDSDIYMALKECNMDPNETTQRLLHQDPYHVVESRRDKRKESMGCKGSVDASKKSENTRQGTKNRPFSDHIAQQGVQNRTAAYGNAGSNREFRVVRHNQVNQNTKREPKLALQQASASSNEDRAAVVSVKGLSGKPGHGKSGTRNLSQASNGPSDSHSRHTTISSSTERKVAFDEKRALIPNASARVQAIKPNSQQHSASLPPSNSVVGVYSSSTDPVHVPSPESRSSSAVGAIKREVGVVGGRRQSSEPSVKNSSTSTFSLSNVVSGRDGSLAEPFQPFLAIPKNDEVSQTVATESVVPNISASRSFLSNQYSRPQQTAMGHQKAAQHSKEWKPKTTKKTSVGSPGVIGTPTKSNSPQADNSKDLESGTPDLQDKLSRVNIYENQNVIIAQHIRVPETDRGRLTFGSFGVDFDSTRNIVSGSQTVGVAEESHAESATSSSVSSPESSSDEASANKQVELVDEQVRSLESNSPAASNVVTEKSPSPPNLDNYAADIGLVQDGSPSPYSPPDSQQRRDPPELSSFPAGYDMSYFRPKIDEAVRAQALPSPHEALTTHAANNMPVSTNPVLHQPPMTQMYPQVHFANLMPYRQFLSPVYVPQMAMPGYSSNPAAYPSNGGSYLLMPGGSSNGLKYGIQQFKQVPGGSPTGYGNFTSPTGYATGLEDSSRIKYKDANHYAPNPQGETSEIWVQNGRQSGPYYNVMGGHTFMPSHSGHSATQSSHMQFPGLYPPTPAQLHHLGPVMGGNPQMGHFNWAPNF